MHCFFEFLDFFVDLCGCCVFFAHVVVPFGVCCECVGGGVIVCWLVQRPIRHRGERRRLRKRKSFVGSFGCAFNLVFPSNSILRLKILYSYKRCELQLKMSPKRGFSLWQERLRGFSAPGCLIVLRARFLGVLRAWGFRLCMLLSGFLSVRQLGTCGLLLLP